MLCGRMFGVIEGSRQRAVEVGLRFSTSTMLIPLKRSLPNHRSDACLPQVIPHSANCSMKLTENAHSSCVLYTFCKALPSPLQSKSNRKAAGRHCKRGHPSALRRVQLC